MMTKNIWTIRLAALTFSAVQVRGSATMNDATAKVGIAIWTAEYVCARLKPPGAKGKHDEPRLLPSP